MGHRVSHLLALPALILAGDPVRKHLGRRGGGSGGTDGSDDLAFFLGSGGVAYIVAFLAWFACLARGRMPSGFRDLVAYALRYNAEVLAYVLVLTDRYPNSDPDEPRTSHPPPSHPIAMEVIDDLEEIPPHGLLPPASRVPASRVARVVDCSRALRHHRQLVHHALRRTLARGVPSLRERVRALRRPRLRLPSASSPTPSPASPGSAARIRSTSRSSRARGRTAGSPASGACSRFRQSWSRSRSTPRSSSRRSWMVRVARDGRMPRGLRNLEAFVLRYSAQLNGYLYLLTDRYPYSGPLSGGGGARAARRRCRRLLRPSSSA